MLDALYDALLTIRYRVAALLAQMPEATRNAFSDQHAYDAMKHPRGANGKFIGGSGYQAYHEASAIRSMASHYNQHPSEFQMQDALWHGIPKGSGFQQLTERLDSLMATARSQGTAQDIADLHYLYQRYRMLSQRATALKLPQATQERLAREMARMRGFFQLHRFQPVEQGTLSRQAYGGKIKGVLDNTPKATRDVIDRGIAQGIRQERADAAAQQLAPPADTQQRVRVLRTRLAQIHQTALRRQGGAA